MWWIALYLPQWPLEALGPPLPDAVEEGGHIVSLGAVAAQAGVRVGMSLPAAELRCPGLKVKPRQPDQEARALRTIALAVSRFSPNLHLRPDGLLMEVQASLRLFGGPLSLWRQMQQLIHSFNVSIHLAAGPFPEAAWLLARVRGPLQQHAQQAPRLQGPNPSPHQGGNQGRRPCVGPPLGVLQSRQPDAIRPVLDGLPVPLVLQAWGAPLATHHLLEGLGVACLGQWRALPRAGLKRRLSEELLQRLDQAYGLAADPQTYWTLPPTFDERLDLPERSADIDLIIQAVRHLLQALEGWLMAQGLMARTLALHLLHESRRSEPLPDGLHTLRLSAPEWRADALLRLWAERLGRQTLIAPVRALRLALHASERPGSQDLQQALPMATRLQAASQDPLETRQALARLLDRLQARLGDQAVQGVRCQDDHRPERASRSVTPKELADDEVHPVAPLPRPLWLLSEPEPLTEHQGRPVHQGHPLALRTRPERIEAGWFDDEPVCRDYHVAEGPDHRLCWIYRERRGPSQGWFLHGWFN